MRPRRPRNFFNEELDSKKLIYISIAVVILAIITFIVIYTIFNNAISKKINGGDISKITDLSLAEKQNTSPASSSMGKTVDEVKEESENETKEDTMKIAINTTNIEKQIEETSNNDDDDDEYIINETTETSTEEDVVPDPTFIKPVEGDIIKEFANESLIYSQTLKEWVTHAGIDIKAEQTTIVKASSDGKIKSIKNDPRYGITVIIQHANGYETVYSNLLTAEFVKEGEEISQGQTIGTVGNTATFEILDDSHLHFEILKDSIYLNPSEYIK